MKPYLKIFISAFLLSTALAIFSVNLPSPISWVASSAIRTLLTVTLILVFTAFYKMGRTVNLAAELRVPVASLAVGSWIGCLVTYSTGTFFYYAGSDATAINGIQIYGTDALTLFSRVFASSVSHVTLQIFPSIFCLALAALALAYIRKARPVVGLPPTIRLAPPESDPPSRTGNTKTILKVGLAALPLSAAFGVFSNSLFLLIVLIDPSSINLSQWFGLLTASMSFIAFLICPVLFFGVFYLLGKSIDLASKAKVVIASLVASSLIGFIAAYVVLAVPYALAANSSSQGVPAIVLSGLFGGILRVFQTLFSVGLAGLTIAYIRTTKPVLEAKTTASSATPQMFS